MRAISSGFIEAVPLLLDVGEDPNYTNQMGNCALYLAIKSNNEQLVKTLLDRGADAKFKGMNGNNAVHAACMMGNLNQLKLVIDAGADPFALNNKKQNAAFSALQSPPDKMLDIFKFLYDNLGLDMNFESNDGTILLELLPDSKHFTDEVAEFLLSHGADVNKKSKNGKTIYEIAMSFDDMSEKKKKLFQEASKEQAKKGT